MKPLEKLPIEVKELVNEGVYSVYTLLNAPDGDVYLLMTPDALWALAEDGAVLKYHNHAAIKSFELGQAVKFPEVPMQNAIKMEYK